MAAGPHSCLALVLGRVGEHGTKPSSLDGLTRPPNSRKHRPPFGTNEEYRFPRDRQAYAASDRGGRSRGRHPKCDGRGRQEAGTKRRTDLLLWLWPGPGTLVVRPNKQDSVAKINLLDAEDALCTMRYFPFRHLHQHNYSRAHDVVFWASRALPHSTPRLGRLHKA